MLQPFRRGPGGAIRPIFAQIGLNRSRLFQAASEPPGFPIKRMTPIQPVEVFLPAEHVIDDAGDLECDEGAGGSLGFLSSLRAIEGAQAA